MLGNRRPEGVRAKSPRLSAFRWKNGEVELLGDLPGGRIFGKAMAVSHDGRFIVGESESAAGPTAFVWDETHGMRGLRETVGNRATLDHPDRERTPSSGNWRFHYAADISADGTVHYRSGYQPGRGMRAVSIAFRVVTLYPHA
jgi:hypothetical protein